MSDLDLAEAIRYAMVEGRRRFGPIKAEDYKRVRCPDCWGRRPDCLLCHGGDGLLVRKDRSAK